jgi:hypothetical protein
MEANVDGSEADAYAKLPAEITELGARLQVQADPVIAKDLAHLLELIDGFHRSGMGRLVEMIYEWRGEVFLESAAKDPLVGVLLEAYDLPLGG